MYVTLLYLGVLHVYRAYENFFHMYICNSNELGVWISELLKENN